MGQSCLGGRWSVDLAGVIGWRLSLRIRRLGAGRAPLTCAVVRKQQLNRDATGDGSRERGRKRMSWPNGVSQAELPKTDGCHG